MQDTNNRTLLIKDQSEEYQRGYADGYSKGYSAMRSRVKAARDEEKKHYEDKLAHIEYSSLYPFNLLQDLLDESGEDGCYSPEILTTLIAGKLTERERRIIELRFRDGLTLQEIGDVFSFSRERIRQIEAKAFQKLEHQLWKARVVPAEDYESLKKDYARVKAENEYWMTRNNAQKDSEDLTVQDTVQERTHSVEEADLSTRSYNGLKRVGIKTLEELQDKTYDDLKHIRNLGRVSILEICQKMTEVGLEPPHIPKKIIGE